MRLEEIELKIRIISQLNPVFSKTPFDFAVESCSKENIQSALSEPTVNVDAKCPATGLPPLNFLVNRIDDNNFCSIFRCIAVLLEHFVNVNIPDNEGITPIECIANKQRLNDSRKREILEFFFKNAIDIEITEETHNLLNEMFNDLELPPMQTIKEEWDFNRLKNCLMKEREEDFLKGLNFITKTSNKVNLDECFTADVPFHSSDFQFTLLTFAVSRGLTNSVKRLLRLGANINYKPRRFEPYLEKFSLTAIEWACIQRNCSILEILLRSSKIDTHVDSPLITISLGGDIFNRSFFPFVNEKCFEELMGSPKIEKVHVETRGSFQYSAFEYACVHFKDKPAIISALLAKGAYIGTDNINARLLEHRFDNCIKRISCREETYPGIEFSYMNLVPAFRSQRRKCFNKEMKVVENISQSEDHRHLLLHPLIQYFLFLKWERLKKVFLLNILAYLLFTAFILVNIFTYYLENARPQNVCSWWLLLVTYVGISLREIFEFTLSPRLYFLRLENYLKLAVLAMVSLVLYNFGAEEATRRTIAAITISLAAGEMFILLGYLDTFSISIYVIMLRTVIISFTKAFVIYGSILLVFASCFVALLYEPDDPPGALSDVDKFDRFWLNLIRIIAAKMLLMVNGDFDLDDIKFDLDLSKHLLFFAFIAIGSVASFTLLVGIAICDIQVNIFTIIFGFVYYNTDFLSENQIRS